MNNEDYKKLNNYLNEMLSYLEKEAPEVIDNLRLINDYSFRLDKELKKYNLEYEIKEKNLSIVDVIYITRNIIKSINIDYLNKFDEILKSGILNFDFGDLDEFIKDDEVKKEDNKKKNNKSMVIYDVETNVKSVEIERNFNYKDVKILVHEFIHYVGRDYNNELLKNYHLLSEFIAIYFESYANDYLFENGISEDEIDYLDRIISTHNKAHFLSAETSVLLAYHILGYIDESTCKELDFLNIPFELSEERFNICTKKLLNNFIKNDNGSNNYNEYCASLGVKFLDRINYFMGFLLAFYSRKNKDMKDIIDLNNSLQKYDINMNELLNGFNIDIFDEHFIDDVLMSVDQYVSKYKSMVIK